MSTPFDYTDDGELVAFGLPISTEAEDIEQEIHAEIQDRAPGWAPLPGHPVTHLAGAVSAVTAESRDALQQRLRSELLDLLGMLFRVPRILGAPASSTVTITARDLLGHIEPGPLPANLGDVELEIPAGITVPVGEATVTVPVVCVEFGDEANGADGDVQLNALDWIADDGVVLDAPLSGGAPRETDAAYSVRMVEEMTTMSSSLILPRDYSIAARRHPAVTYAWTLPHYDATTDDDEAVLHVTTVIAGSDGGDVPTFAYNEVLAGLTGSLIDNVVLHLVGPTHVPISVTTVVRGRPGWDPADVESAVVEHLQYLLAPTTAATPKFGDDANPTPATRIHVNELIARVDDVDSLDYVDSLQIGDGSTQYIDLGPQELSTPGVLSVTVI